MIPEQFHTHVHVCHREPRWISKKLPWSQRFFLFFIVLVGAGREPGEHKSRSGEHEKKNLWLLWIWISLSCRRQGQDPTLGFGLVDIFTNTQINTIGQFDWQYRGDSGDICYCTCCVYITTRENNYLQNTAVLSLYKRSRFVCVPHWFCLGQCLQRNLISVLEERFTEIESLNEHQSLAGGLKSVAKMCSPFCQPDIEGKFIIIWLIPVGKYHAWQAIHTLTVS